MTVCPDCVHASKNPIEYPCSHCKVITYGAKEYHFKQVTKPEERPTMVVCPDCVHASNYLVGYPCTHCTVMTYDAKENHFKQVTKPEEKPKMQLSPFNPNDVIDSECSTLNCPACGSKQVVAGLMEINNGKIEIPISCNLCASETIRSYAFTRAYWAANGEIDVELVEPCIGFESEATSNPEPVTMATPCVEFTTCTYDEALDTAPEMHKCYSEVNELKRQIMLLEERNQRQERHINTLIEVNNLLSNAAHQPTPTPPVEVELSQQLRAVIQRFNRRGIEVDIRTAINAALEALPEKVINEAAIY